MSQRNRFQELQPIAGVSPTPLRRPVIAKGCPNHRAAAATTLAARMSREVWSVAKVGTSLRRGVSPRRV
eukprot:scaffold61712_cov69-Phaeocystis_antarctica.AAC.16